MEFDGEGVCVTVLASGGLVLQGVVSSSSSGIAIPRYLRGAFRFITSLDISNSSVHR